MKKTFTLMALLAIAITSFAQEKKIKVISSLSDYTVQAFDRALGADRYEIDSLVVYELAWEEPDCFALIRDCCEKGRLTGINLYYCRALSEIPAAAFYPTLANGAPRKAETEGEKDFTRTNLRYITLPTCLDKIGDNAFANTNLETIEIPYLTKEIGQGAFAGCTYLKDVSFVGNRVKSDNAAAAFYDLSPDAVLHVAGGLANDYRVSGKWTTFKNIQEQSELCNVLDITLDGSRTLEEALQDCDMKLVDSMKLSGPVTKADMTFLKPNVRYERLKCLDLTDSQIEDGELFSCRMGSLRMPKQMKTIYHGFLSKSRIDHLVMPERYEEIGHTAFEYYNWFVDSTLVIPEGCRKLSYQAFNGCRSIKLLMLPSTLETLEPNSLGFSYPLGGRVVSMDVYVNRMYPPTSTQICEYRNEEIDPASENGPFGCQEEGAGCLTRNMRLFVPVGAKKNYENAEHWNHFTTIIETPELTGTPDGIARVVTDAKTSTSSAADGVYTADGRLVTRDMSTTGLRHGLYIVKEGGKARKVLK